MGAAEPVDEQSRLSAPGATVVLPGTDSEVHMHDDSWESTMPPEYWRAMEYADPRGDLTGARLAHLVFLDGRLVDSWSEDPRGTSYAPLAAARDEERARLLRQLAPQAPPKPTHERTLEWLDAMAGGRSALLAMTTDLLRDPDLPPTVEASAADAQRLELLWRRLEPAGELFGAESLSAARALVTLLWTEDRTALTVPTPDRVLAGVTWVVARANDLFRRAAVTHAVVREVLDISTPLTSHGQALHRAIGGLPVEIGSPWHQSELLPVGRVDLLTSTTRRRLVRLRDQALEASAVAAAAS